jgi:hypothetical protein
MKYIHSCVRLFNCFSNTALGPFFGILTQTMNYASQLGMQVTNILVIDLLYNNPCVDTQNWQD